MHDLSDGFVIPGPRSVPNVPGGISTTAAQLRSDDGETVVELNPAAQTVTITAPSGATVNANTTVNGNLTVTGNAKIDGTLEVDGDATLKGDCAVKGTLNLKNPPVVDGTPMTVP